MRKTMLAAAGLWLGLAATVAQAQTSAKPCLTDADATALVVAILPDTLDGLGKRCAGALPETAMLRAGLSPLLYRYRPEADAAWPQASTALSKLGTKEAKLLSSDQLRPVMGAMIGEKLTEDIKPTDCPKIDRMVRALSPLPARNIADTFIALLQLGDSKKGPALDLCPSNDAPVGAGRP